MRTLFAPILALVLATGIHYGLSRPQHAVVRAEFCPPPPAKLRAAPDLEFIDEFLGLKRDLIYPVTVTGYSSCPEECDDDPFITASNTHVRQGVIALSRDLLKRYNPNAPFSWGDRIYLQGVGEFTVEDAMNARYTLRADIWFPNRKLATDWGVKNLKLIVPPAESWLI